MDNLLLVFPHNVVNTEEWYDIIDKFDEQNYYVYVLNDISTSDFDIGYLPNIIDYYKNLHENINKIVIMSNARELIFSWFRCYNPIVDDFIYFIDENENNCLISEDEHFAFYYNLYEFNGIYKEKIQGNIYLNKKDERVLPVYYEQKYFDYFLNFDFFNKAEKKPFNKKYIFNGFEYIFECSKEDINIINLDNLKERNTYVNSTNLQLIDRYIKLIKNYDINLTELNKIKNDFYKFNNFEKRIFEFKMKNELYKRYYDDKFKMFLNSFLLYVFNKEEYLVILFNLLIKSNNITKFNRFFAYYQCVQYMFLNKYTWDEKIFNIRNNVYDKLYEEFLPRNYEYKKILKKDRNNDLIFVICSQVLHIHHAPTKVALDVCYKLIKNLNKKVILINTKEAFTEKGFIPMQDILFGNVINEYEDTNTIKYKDLHISFYQPSISMPDDKEIINILSMAEKFKPDLVINIGAVLVGDLCGEIVPTITIPMGNSGYSKSTFYVVNDEKMYKDYNEKFGIDRERLIISKFQFELKDKRSSFTKKQLGIPENKFIISVIGNRLNDEIDEMFLEILDKSCKYSNAYVVFISEFDFNKSQVSKYKNLINNYKNIGYQVDLLAIMENTDLYLNPNRSGGGTSAIYSLYEGKPVVTLNYGDVAINVGEEFCVNNYEEMFSQIDKYHTDIEFYNKQSCIAKKRAMELTDMATYIKNIYSQITKSNLYY